MKKELEVCEVLNALEIKTGKTVGEAWCLEDGSISIFNDDAEIDHFDSMSSACQKYKLI